MDIHILQTDPAVELAGYELARCLGDMTGRQIEVVEGGKPGPQPDIYLGTGESLGEIADLPDVDDPGWDDAYALRTVDESLVIAGVNPRSVLMGVYGYLRELGAEWLWPGEDGEVLPQIEQVPLQGYAIVEVPPNRHRGVCIEGATSLEHVLDMVEWMPKIGLNSYFLQFPVAAYFWRLWYGHALNPKWEERRDLSEEECEQLDRQVIAALKERGLLLHQVGHGWTAAALGLPASGGWVKYDGEISDEMRELMAEVDGQRGLWGGIPINTELCYGNPEARRRIIDTVLEYARNHLEVDALYFVLSDSVNNHCECELCRDIGPWDWHAMLLNELSPRLKQVAPDMKLVFDVYADLLWPPDKVALDTSHGNLVIIFAPIGRCYGHSLADPDCGAEPTLQRPARNQLEMPRENRSLVWLWQQWNWTDRANSFVFDYHFMWPWMGDRLTVDLERLLPQDIQDYEHLGLGGLMNCGTQRIFYPHGWPFYLTARLLWGESPDAADRARYYALAYGDDASLAQGFLEGITARSGGPIHQADRWQQVPSQQLPELLEFLEQSRADLEEAASRAETPTHRRAWGLLLHYQELVSRFVEVQRSEDAGDLKQAVGQIEAIEQFLQETESEVAPALDCYIVLRNLQDVKSAWES